MRLSKSNCTLEYTWMNSMRHRLPGGEDRMALLRYNGGNKQQVYDVLLDVATNHSTQINEILDSYLNTKRWGRGKPAAKYWLRVRWAEAINYLNELLPKQHDTSNSPLAQIDTNVVKYLIHDYWHDVGVHFYLRDNADEHLYLDDEWGMIWEEQASFNAMIESIHNGDMMPEKKH